MSLQHKRSSIAHKRPVATSLNDGQLALNLNATSPGVFFKNSSNVLTKVGPVHVGTSAPNSSPATGGSTGNSIGEQWLDTTGGTYVLKIWDGTAWRSESGTFVDVSGDTMTGALILPSGTEAAPALGVGSSDNGLYLPATDELGVSTNGSERLRIDSSGNIGIGTTSPGHALDLIGTTSNALRIRSSTAASRGLEIWNDSGNDIAYISNYYNGSIVFQTGNTERARIDSSGQVGIGTTSPDGTFHVHTATAGSVSANASADNLIVENSGAGGISILTPDASAGGLFFGSPGDNIGAALRWNHDNDQFQIGPDKSGAHLRLNSGDGVEAMRIDSSGRLLVGLSTARQTGSGFTAAHQVEGGGTISAASLTITSNRSTDDLGARLNFARSKGGSVGSNTVVDNNAELGGIYFWGADGTDTDSQGAEIIAEVDGTPGSNDMPTRLVFGTTADGGSSPTERMRIDSSGHVMIGSTTDFANINCDDLQVGDTGNANTGITLGSSSQAQIAFADSGDARAGVIHYQHTDNSLRFMTNGAANERMRIDSSGNVGIGTSSPGADLHVKSSGATEIRSESTGDNALVSINNSSAVPWILTQRSDTSNGFSFRYSGNNYVNIDTSGRVGIGTTSPSSLLHLESASSPKLLLVDTTNSCTLKAYAQNSNAHLGTESSHDFIFDTNNTERMRIDSSGRVLVGTTSARGVGHGTAGAFEIEGTSATVFASVVKNSADAYGGSIALGKSRGTSVGANTAVQSGDELGSIRFAGADGTDVQTRAAQITAAVDGTPGSNDMPGRLVFSTTADGASSPTERMRIHNNGDVGVGTSTQYPGDGNTNNGVYFENNGKGFFSKNNGLPLLVNRNGNDGTLVEFRQAGASEGTISVSGSTVSYNGGHLSRWAQLASGAARTEILRGSVLSNLDEMCEWAHAAQDAVLYTEEDELPEGVSVGDVKTPAVDAYTENNEQLNRMKVSDVEGDRNVAGVFQGWDDDDDTYTNDFYCAMTGDFIIRIAQGTTVARGDLLMSAGDGTAKPQDDDIVRSKTIAKVTSTTVSTTYTDGSYCVPCVLMAC